jgi:dihydrofolate reductase
VNDIERTVGSMLMGRRMYETLAVWETMDVAGEPAVMADFQRLWLAADKIVYSRTLATPATERTRIEREFDPAAVRALVERSGADVSVGGPTLAAHVFAAGLVDECHVFLVPVVVGGGLRAFPDGVRAGLRLLDQRRFTGGVVHLHYQVG